MEDETEDKITKKTKRKLASPYEKIFAYLQRFCEEKKIPLTEDLRRDIPCKWELHGDLIIFPDTCFCSKEWALLGDKEWTELAQIFKCTRVAQKSVITNDSYRSPKVRLILGLDGWVTHKDNGIRYSYDVTRCMFSAGNITEKLRISKLDCRGETVVDLFAGIGYFTLPYLVHAGAEFVHACEWNPDAITALRHNIQQNGVQDRCAIYEGDNRQVCPRDVADRVNLGLIPSSETSWVTACVALRSSSGGFLHIHGNVNTMEVENNHSDGLCTNCGSLSKDVSTFLENKSDTNVKVCEKSVETLKTIHRKCLCNESVDKSFHCKNLSWQKWSELTCDTIQNMLYDLHSKLWCVRIHDVIRIKKYAPHIDHVVLDLECRPYCIGEK